MDNPNFIKNLEIKNYKSIKHLQMDCKRVNLFIGEPNVGKSNILEAMYLFNIDSVVYNNYLTNGTNRIRKKLNELFFDNDVNNLSEITIDDTKAEIVNSFGRLYLVVHLYEKTQQAILKYESSQLKSEKKDLNIDFYNFLRNNENFNGLEYKIVQLDLKNSQTVSYSSNFNGIKKVLPFIFDKRYFNSQHTTYRKNLIPPYGENLLEVLNSNQELYEYIDNEFKKYGLRFSINDDELVVVKNDKKFKIFPFENTADTFQRLVFYLGAIETNINRVLIFEEPEVHSFPPYIAQLASRIVDKKDNQFFITTHSPYMFNEFIDNLSFEELNVNVVYYEDYQTKIRTLTEEELRHASDIGTDIFFNLDRYVKA